MTTSPAAKKPSKTAFVRALPADMSAKDVVAKAKGAGLKISEAYVYTIRSSTRARKGGVGKPAGAKRGPGRPKGSKNRGTNSASLSVSSSGARSAESSFRKLVLDLGVRRSRELLDDVESKLQRLIAGS